MSARAHVSKLYNIHKYKNTVYIELLYFYRYEYIDKADSWIEQIINTNHCISITVRDVCHPVYSGFVQEFYNVQFAPIGVLKNA